MAYSNQTTNYGLPLPTDSDKSGFTDYNTSFDAVDTALKGAVDAIAALTTRVAALEALNLDNAVVYDATNGTGLTNAQASKLKINS